jgi:hypothetical protein
MSDLFALELANVTCGLLRREVIRFHEALPRCSRLMGFEDNRHDFLVVDLFLKAILEAIKVSIEDTARRVKTSYRRLADEDSSSCSNTSRRETNGRPGLPERINLNASKF